MLSDASRRTFLRSGAAAATAASYSRVLGANEKVRVGVIGTGGRGQYLMKELTKMGGAEFPAVCDVYSVRADQAATIAGGSVRTYKDHRQLLEHRDLDAVIVATPDHWHGSITVDACKAGKDVYVEKPMVHFPKDGQALVKAAREHKRIVQVGMQARAIPHYQEARQRYVESGALGKVGLVRTWYNANSGYVLKPPDGMQQKPDGLDWDRWLGPGPKRPWNPDVYFSPYKWLYYDGGMIMGIGIHVIDSAHQFMKLSKPSAAVAGGGIYLYNDGRDTPDVINVVIEYPQALNVTFEAEIMTVGVKGTSYAGIELHGTGGLLTVHRYQRDLGYSYIPHPENSSAPAAQGPGDPPSAQWLLQNWLDCIKTRAKPIANEEEGYYSSMACFMGNTAYQNKRRITWDSKWDLPAA
jgi:predicted dehydrogenase